MPTRFQDLPKDQTCNSPEHDPPSMIVIPPGKKMVHTCPSCGKVTEVIPAQVRW